MTVYNQTAAVLAVLRASHALAANLTDDQVLGLARDLIAAIMRVHSGEDINDINRVPVKEPTHDVVRALDAKLQASLEGSIKAADVRGVKADDGVHPGSVLAPPEKPFVEPSPLPELPLPNPARGQEEQDRVEENTFPEKREKLSNHPPASKKGK